MEEEFHGLGVKWPGANRVLPVPKRSLKSLPQKRIQQKKKITTMKKEVKESSYKSLNPASVEDSGICQTLMQVSLIQWWIHHLFIDGFDGRFERHLSINQLPRWNDLFVIYVVMMGILMRVASMVSWKRMGNAASWLVIGVTRGHYLTWVSITIRNYLVNVGWRGRW